MIAKCAAMESFCRPIRVTNASGGVGSGSRLPPSITAQMRLKQAGDQRGNAMAIELTVNGVSRFVDVAPQTPLLWVIRDQLGLTGTKFSCGIAQCGACTLHIDDQPFRSCSVPVSAAVGKAVTTIEGLSPNGTHPVQLA